MKVSTREGLKNRKTISSNLKIYQISSNQKSGLKTHLVTLLSVAVLLRLMGKIGILLVGHGSKKEYNKDLITKTAALIAERNPDYIVKCGFMEFNEPTIPNALEMFKTEDIDSLAVVPLFLARGVHIDEDIPGILNLKAGEKKGTFALNSREIPLVYAGPIGPNPLLADLMAENAKAALSLL
jgi:sirohydrochlorin cobaltochelatase